MIVFFFFQAEDGIRDVAVTGVQTCALPISSKEGRPRRTSVGYTLQLRLSEAESPPRRIADLPPAPFRQRRHPRPRSRATVGRSGRRLLACNQLRPCLRNRRVFPRRRDRRSIQGARTTSRVLRRKTLSPENRTLSTTVRPGCCTCGGGRHPLRPRSASSVPDRTP